jgi:hypothetical protein
MNVYVLEWENTSKKICSGKWVSFFTFNILFAFILLRLKWLKKSDIVRTFSYFYNDHGLEVTPKTSIIYEFCLFVYLLPSVDIHNWAYTVFWILCSSEIRNSGMFCKCHHFHGLMCIYLLILCMGLFPKGVLYSIL